MRVPVIIDLVPSGRLGRTRAGVGSPSSDQSRADGDDPPRPSQSGQGGLYGLAGGVVGVPRLGLEGEEDSDPPGFVGQVQQ
jgi:hypothetical protein